MSEAAWCAGILSHYYTDPIQPFHTAQSDAENAIHRATEWSISKSYDDLVADALHRGTPGAPPPDDGEHWLQDYVCLGADTSHAHYERLIAHYDISTGVVTPEKGLDPVGRRIVGDLLIYARTGLAHILDRAFEESAATPPTVNLTVQGILATLAMPKGWILKRMEDAEARRQVEAMYDELMETGVVDKTLPEDDKVVRDLHRAEVAAPRRSTLTAERAKRIKSGREKPARQSLLGIAPSMRSPHRGIASTGSVPVVPPPPRSAGDVTAPQVDGQPEKRGEELAALQPEWQRYFLTITDDIEAAPSIGPKTAERLGRLGLLKVSDLMEADPAKIATNLGDSRITQSTVEGWQDQSRLMLQIPGLRVTQAQLLAGAGYRFTEDIAEAEPHELSADILAFAATQSGRRLLRDGDPPDIEKIKSWIDAAHASSKAA